LLFDAASCRLAAGSDEGKMIVFSLEHLLGKKHPRFQTESEWRNGRKRRADLDSDTTPRTEASAAAAAAAAVAQAAAAATAEGAKALGGASPLGKTSAQASTASLRSDATNSSLGSQEKDGAAGGGGGAAGAAHTLSLDFSDEFELPQQCPGAIAVADDGKSESAEWWEQKAREWDSAVSELLAQIDGRPQQPAMSPIDALVASADSTVPEQAPAVQTQAQPMAPQASRVPALANGAALSPLLSPTGSSGMRFSGSSGGSGGAPPSSADSLMPSPLLTDRKSLRMHDTATPEAKEAPLSAPSPLLLATGMASRSSDAGAAAASSRMSEDRSASERPSSSDSDRSVGQFPTLPGRSGSRSTARLAAERRSVSGSGNTAPTKFPPLAKAAPAGGGAAASAQSSSGASRTQPASLSRNASSRGAI
jgi:hypothetical protein